MEGEKASTEEVDVNLFRVHENCQLEQRQQFLLKLSWPCALLIACYFHLRSQGMSRDWCCTPRLTRHDILTFLYGREITV